MDLLSNSSKCSRMISELKLFHKTEKERTPPCSFHKTRIVLIPKLDKDNNNKITTKTYRSTFLMNKDVKYKINSRSH